MIINISGPFYRINDDAIQGILNGMPYCFNRIDTPNEWAVLQEYLAEAKENILPPKVFVPTTQMLLDEQQQYLDSTDWYITRMVERNVLIPEDVQIKRADAIAKINELRLIL